MPVRLYSTLSGREEELVPQHADGTIRMYVCGLTPKFHVHLGHARVFVAMDVLRRYLEYRGYKLKHVQNFTDIDDKIIQRAALEKRDARSTADSYMDSYFDSMDRLKVKRADEYPTVTGYMERIVEFIAGLVENSHAYAIDTGDVYFDVASFPGYGKLSKRDLNSQLVAARKELEPGKRDPRDFALWKAARPGEPSWPSPWGAGRPGWHIECSAMVRETLGDTIDIHGGGADLIFPHHENEIAQSESLTGQEFVRTWAHTGLLTTGGEKMAHSLSNFLQLREILDQYEPMAVRYYLVASHYRSSLALLVDESDGSLPRIRGIEDAQAALGRLRRALGDEPLEAEGELDAPSVQAFEAAMDADLNTPEALAVIFELARQINTERAVGGDTSLKRRTLVRLLDVLGLDAAAGSEANRQQSIEPFVDLLLETRRKLREVKQWALADELRDRLKSLGVVVEDRPGGESTWRLERTP
jgi:cysteinyl-tRNA synthetase